MVLYLPRHLHLAIIRSGEEQPVSCELRSSRCAWTPAVPTPSRFYPTIGPWKVWDLVESKSIETVGTHSEAVNTVVVRRDGLLFTGSDDSMVTTT